MELSDPTYICGVWSDISHIPCVCVSFSLDHFPSPTDVVSALPRAGGCVSMFFAQGSEENTAKQ